MLREVAGEDAGEDEGEAAAEPMDPLPYMDPLPPSLHSQSGTWYIGLRVRVGVGVGVRVRVRVRARV